MIAEDVPPIPRDLWHWGIANRNGRLKRHPENIIKLNLLNQGEATVTASGIQFKGMHYGCDLAMKEQWFVKVRAGKKWRVKVCYDPRTTNEIYLWLDEGHKFEPCYLLEREERYCNKRFEEVGDLHEIEKYQGRQQEAENLISKVELDAQAEAIISAATKQTDDAIRRSQESNSQRVKGTKKRRSSEKMVIREQEVFRLTEQEKVTSTTSDNVVPLKRDSAIEKPKDNYVSPADKLSKIKSYMLEDGDDDWVILTYRYFTLVVESLWKRIIKIRCWKTIAVIRS
jgi:hypothetical protein